MKLRILIPNGCTHVLGIYVDVHRLEGKKKKISDFNKVSTMEITDMFYVPMTK